MENIIIGENEICKLYNGIALTHKHISYILKNQYSIIDLCLNDYKTGDINYEELLDCCKSIKSIIDDITYKEILLVQQMEKLSSIYNKKL